MKHRILGRTGLRVSEIGLGGHEYMRPLPTTLGRWGEIDHEAFMNKQPDRNELIETAVEAGINYFDATQPEEAKSLGIALQQIGVRDEVYVALMILRPLKKLSSEPQANWNQFIKKDVSEKLDLLQCDYADILNIHLPEIGYSKERLISTIEALKELREEGIIGWIGASSHEPRFLAELIRSFDCFDSVMVRYNYYLQEAREVLFPLCKVREVGVVVMKPIVWPYYGIPFTYFDPRNLEPGPLTAAQTSLRWILRSEEVSTIVPGINTLNELKENMDAIEKDGKVEEKILSEYLMKAKSPEVKAILEKMTNDPRIDIRYFAERVLNQYFAE